MNLGIYLCTAVHHMVKSSSAFQIAGGDFAGPGRTGSLEMLLVVKVQAHGTGTRSPCFVLWEKTL